MSSWVHTICSEWHATALHIPSDVGTCKVIGVTSWNEPGDGNSRCRSNNKTPPKKKKAYFIDKAKFVKAVVVGLRDVALRAPQWNTRANIQCVIWTRTSTRLYECNMIVMTS